MNVFALMDVATHFQQWASLMMLFSVRPAVAFLILPATTEPMMTATVRNLLTLVFAFHVASGASLEQFAALSGGPVGLGLAMAREAMIGFTIGFAASKGFWIAESVGAVVDNLAGYNNVQLINPSSSEQNTPVSDILKQLFVAVFWAAGGMLLLLGAMNETYRWWPVLEKTPQWPVFPERLAEIELAGMMRTVVSLALPILFILAFIDIGLGLVSRAAKNVDTSALGQPLKSAAALFAMALFSSVFLQDVKTYMALADLPAWLAGWRTLR